MNTLFEIFWNLDNYLLKDMLIFFSSLSLIRSIVVFISVFNYKGLIPKEVVEAFFFLRDLCGVAESFCSY